MVAAIGWLDGNGPVDAHEAEDYLAEPRSRCGLGRAAHLRRVAGARSRDCVPDRTVNAGDSGALTVTGEHVLTWAAAAQTAASRSLPGWGGGCVG